MTPAARREAWQAAQEKLGLSQRRACRLVGIQRSVARYESKNQEPSELLTRLKELAWERKRFGYRRLHRLLVWEGFLVNHKRVYRLYHQEGLMVRRSQRKKRFWGERGKPAPPVRTNQRWSMDFVQDGLWDGRRFRVLTLVDDFSRENLALEVGSSLPGFRVVEVLERVSIERGTPETVVLDNGPEFTGKDLAMWAYQKGVTLSFIEPGKPVQNAFIESFNGKFRDECLNQHWFANLAEAEAIITAWRQDYNTMRPHSSLQYQTPQQWADQQAALAGGLS